MTDKQVLKQLYEAHATLTYASHKKTSKCIVTTYTIASIDHPIEFEDDECVEIYDKGSQIKLFEYVGKTKFFKHCVLIEKKYKNDVNYAAAKEQQVVAQDNADLDAE